MQQFSKTLSCSISWLFEKLWCRSEARVISKRSLKIKGVGVQVRDDRAVEEKPEAVYAGHFPLEREQEGSKALISAKEK